MSKIATYQLADTPLELSDRLIGTEAIRPYPTPTPLATKNFSLAELLNLFQSNFPSDTLQQVLDAGNTATQNMTVNGTINSTVIKPTNIEDILGSQGTVFQYLSKGVTGINWVTLPIDNLQAVLNAGNTATQNMVLVGNITSTLITPTNIKDELGNNGTTGQVLTKTGTGIRWQSSPSSSAVWGSITGTITAQTDLIAYLSGNYYPLSSNPAGYITQESVLEYPNLAAFPPTGASNTIYIALDTDTAYYWNGSSYVVLTTSTSGISGFGIVNRIAKFTPDGSNIRSSKISEGVSGDVKINDSGRALLSGNSIVSIQRIQSQIDFVLGNPSLTQLSSIICDNTIGLSIDSKGYLSLKAGTSYTEGLRVLSTGKLQVAQTPDNGTTSDKLLVRDALGNVKQLDYPTTGASVGFEQNFLLMGA